MTFDLLPNNSMWPANHMTKDTILFYMRSKADRSQLNLSQETKKVKKYNKWEKTWNNMYIIRSIGNIQGGSKSKLLYCDRYFKG